MCGIIGFSGNKQAKDIILSGLHSLEYRGYDSAGLSLMTENGFEIKKCKGRVLELDEKCKAIKFDSTVGIGHTRWATHGQPSVVNAHPHMSNSCVLVHNGIIENYASLKRELQNDGYVFYSETDTECIVHLIDREYKSKKDARRAIRETMSVLKGSFAVCVMFSDRKDEIWCFRRDNPLIVGKNSDGTYISSDIPALLPYTKEILRPNDDEIVCVNGNEIILYNKYDRLSDLKYDTITWDVEKAQKDGYDYFMLKEIYEQPEAILNTASQYTNQSGLPDLDSIGLNKDILSSFDSVSVIGCGSATHAGLVGKYLIENLAKIPVFVSTASEYRYSQPITIGNALTVAVSQSGETADTLAALRLAKKNGCKSLGIINAVGSAIARESDSVIYTNAGPEIAVATTKGYTTQLVAFVLLAVALAVAKNTINENEAHKIINELEITVPKAIKQILNERQYIKEIAKHISHDKDLYFIGRGVDNFASVECSLKLKEISYIHSEAYAAGELKHGTLSLIEEGTPVVALSTSERYYDKMIGNIREVISRGAKVILVCDEKFPSPEDNSFAYYKIPDVSEYLSPLISVVFSQLLAYETALLLGFDVDHPRNLAKSVTVE